MWREVIVYSCAVFILSGCTPLRSITQSKIKADNTASSPLLPSYSGPQAHIAVTDFDIKAATGNSEIGAALRQMLTTLLINSERFSVVERKEQPADLIIAAVLTEFEPQTSGGRAGIGGGGGINNGLLGGLLGTNLNKARMALDMRIIDASTSGVLSATNVQGQASDAPGRVSGDLFGAIGMPAALSIYADTPMEKAIRICIIEAVRYIYQNVPEQYYKYKNGKT